MSNKRVKKTGKGRCGRFLQFPYFILNHPRFPLLKAHACKAILDLGRQYNGHNNGSFIATEKYLKERGWKSKNSFYAGRTQLINNGLLIISQHGYKRLPTRYAFTWLVIDEGPHHLTPTRTPLGAWKDPSEYPKPKNINPFFDIDLEIDDEVILLAVAE